MKQLLFALCLVVVFQIQTGCSSFSGHSSSSEKVDANDADGRHGGAATGSGDSSVITADSMPTKKELYDQIQIALGSGDDSAVEKSVANLLSQDQGDSKALNSLALYHSSKGRFQLAKMVFKAILDKDPQNAIALNNLGALYSQTNEPKKAIDSFRKAVLAKPDYPTANANLGAIFAMGKDFGKARGFLKVAYKAGIRDLALLNNYAVSLMASGDSEAEDIFKEALKVGVSDVIVSFNYALYLTYVKKDYKEAGEMLDKIKFMGVPAQKRVALAKMEEVIGGNANGNVESKSQ